MIDVFTDGATVGHNGKLGTVKEVGLGIAIPEKDIFISRKELGISNNEAEFKALIFAMKTAIENQLTYCNFNMDSKIVVNRANGARPKKLKHQNERMNNFQDEVMILKKQFDEIEFTWIPREENTVADELSKIACKINLNS
jgi:ribonuclease HI